MKKLIYLISMIMFGQILSAQQLPIYSQYLYNKFLINPAHAGSDGFTSLNVTVRQQWVGYSGAPRTYSVSWQTRVLKKGYDVKQNIFNKTVYRPKNDGKVGFGGYIFSDKNGLVRKTGIQLAYSYHLWLQDKTQLSLGLAINGYYLTVDVDQNSFLEQNEPMLNNNLRKGVFVPNADFGVYILNPRYDIGFSAQQLFGSSVILGNLGATEYKMYRHYYMFGSFNIRSAEKSVIQPSLLVKTSEQLRPQADLGMTYIYDQNFWAGIAYRTSGAIIANVMVRYVPVKLDKTSFYFGYAFDFTSNKIQRATYGSHEITMAVKFGDSSKRYRWLDRF
jgi:type IX secretion system PorP/SprF family membrane protein